RDLDYQRLYDIFAEGAPQFHEMALFIVREDAKFDPGASWAMELLVRRQTGPVDSIFTSFELPYQIPEEYIERPQPTAEELAAIEEANRPMWVNIWYQKSFQMTYHNEDKCPPLVAKKKKRQRNKQAPEEIPGRIPVVQLDPSA